MTRTQAAKRSEALITTVWSLQYLTTSKTYHIVILQNWVDDGTGKHIADRFEHVPKKTQIPHVLLYNNTFSSVHKIVWVKAVVLGY